MSRYPPWLPRKPKPPGRHTGGRYTHGSDGRAPDIPNSPYFRSRAERNYCRWLGHHQVRWEYEPRLFVFEPVRGGKNRTYKPDFWLPDEGCYHEVKLWLDKDSRIKLNYMRKYYPDVRVIVIPKQLFADIERQGICRLIAHWECGHFPDRITAETKTYVEIPGTNVKKRRRR